MSKIFRSIYNNLTLKNKILILNALVIISSLIILAYFANSISSEAIIGKAEKSSIRELELIDSNLNTLIRSIEDYSKVIATNDRLQEYLMELFNSNGKVSEDTQVDESTNIIKIKPVMTDILRNIIYPNTPIFVSAIFINNNAVYVDKTIDNHSFQNVIKENFLNTAFKLQKPIWSDLLKLTLNDGKKENVFAVAKLVIDINSGNKTGIVVLFINEKDISKNYTENSSKVNNRYYVLNANDIIISSEDKNNLNKNIQDIISLEQVKYDELKRTGRIIVNQNNKKFLLSMQSFDKLGWNIISTISLDEITEEKFNIQKVIIIVGILCLIFAVIFSYLISYTVTKPVQKLTSTMKLIMVGNMNVRAEIEDSSEIGILTQGFNNLMDKIQDLLKDIVAEQKAKQEFEFKLIQSQIKPHFLYNSLETILSLNKLERNEDAMQVTKSLANFYRLSLSKGNDMIKISEEVQIIKDYLYIQKQRYSNYMDFSLDIDEEILDFYIPKLTLQPLVENSIYHGLKYKNNKGKLEIKGYMDNEKIVLVVFDDGVGIYEEKINLLLSDQPQIERKEDFGLGSVDRRIKLLYGNEFGLKIQSEVGSYTRVFVNIPVLRMKG
jgi:two-component system, sensor histidine kinase YesM